MLGTIEAFRAYATARGNSSPADAVDIDATAALVRATDYIRYHYIIYFSPPYDENSPRVQDAVYEAAIIELRNPNFFTQTYTPGKVKELVGVDSLKWQMVNVPTAKGEQMLVPKSTKIDDMLDLYMGYRYGFGGIVA